MARPHRAGQNLRTGSAPYERATNAHQRRLVQAYDSWASATRPVVRRVLEQGIPPSQLVGVLASPLSVLEQELMTLARQGVLTAARTSVGRSRSQNPRVQGLTQNLIAQNTHLIQTQLVPSIGSAIVSAVQGIWPVVPSSIPDLVVTVFAAQRAKVAQYAGGAWVAIFEVQRMAGLEQERETGEPQRVRWNLHPEAQHCTASIGKHGCPDLVGVYNSWAELPTVPAGDVTCRGNCRCWLEVEVDGEWQRGL